MPHSINLPSPNVLSKETSTTPAYKTMLSEDQLVKVFIEAMGEENWELVKKGERRVVNTCGSGMTVRLFARLEQLKHPTKLLTRVLSTSCRRQFFGWPYNERELVRMLRFTTRCVFLDFDQLCSLYVPKIRELKSSNMSHRAGLDTLPTKRARSSRKSKMRKRLDSPGGSRKAVPYLPCHIDLSFFSEFRPSPSSSFAFHSITPLFNLAKKA